MKATATQIETAKQLISEYCLSEFGKDADYINIEDVGIAYSTDEPYNPEKDEYGETFDVQVSVDIINMTVKKEIGWEITSIREFSSWEEFENYLEWLDFCELITVEDAEWNTLFQKRPSWKPAWWDEYYTNL